MSKRVFAVTEHLTHYFEFDGPLPFDPENPVSMDEWFCSLADPVEAADYTAVDYRDIEEREEG